MKRTKLGLLATLMTGLIAVGTVPAAAFEAASPAGADHGAEMQRRSDDDDDRRKGKSGDRDHDRKKRKGHRGDDDGPRCLGLVVVCLG